MERGRLGLNVVQLDEMGRVFRQKDWTGQAKQKNTPPKRLLFPLFVQCMGAALLGMPGQGPASLNITLNPVILSTFHSHVFLLIQTAVHPS